MKRADENAETNCKRAAEPGEQMGRKTKPFFTLGADELTALCWVFKIKAGFVFSLLLAQV